MRTLLLLLLVLLGLLTSPSARAQSGIPAGASTALSGGFAFVENRGQWPDGVLFRGRTGGADLWVTADALVFDFYAVERVAQAASAPRRPERVEPEREGTETARRGHVVAMRFEGARARRATGHGRREAYHNYFLGSDPAHWASHVPLYEEVVLEGLYDGVDLRLYADGGLPRYDLVLAPGADLQQVRMRLEGADGVALTPGGALRMETSLGPVEQRGLAAYHEGAGGRRDGVASAFCLEADGTLGFKVGGADPSRALVVDPLIWATFLGEDSDDAAYAVAVGADGAATVAGYTFSSDFPTTVGAYDASYNGVGDVFVTRLSLDGSALLYATFLGGRSGDGASAVAVGAGGSVTVAGGTSSPDFPATAGAFDTSYNGGFNDGDAFVARLSPDGSTLLYSTYLGGEDDDTALALAVGADGAATVAGGTVSAGFPTTAGAYDESFNGNVDAFVARLALDGTSLIYATFLGGTDDDDANAVAVGPDGAATIAGGTSSPDFPATAGAFDTSYNGGGFGDAFVARLAPDGNALRYSTFLGGAAGSEFANAVAVGADGAATVAGHTSSSDFPATAGAYGASSCDSWDATVARLSADGASLLYAACLGGTGDDYVHGHGLAVGADGSAVVAGRTDGDFPTTAGAYDESFNGNVDAFVVRLSPDGAALLYGTYLGGRTFDQPYALAMGADGSATVVGYTFSPDFPTTPGAYDTSYNGDHSEGFVARLDVDGTSGALAVDAEPVSPPIVIPSTGGTFAYTVTTTNSTAVTQTFQLWTRVTKPNGQQTPALRGPITRTLAPGASVTDNLTQSIPGGIPAGAYTYTAYVGTYPSEVLASDAFTFTKQATPGATAAGRVTNEEAVWSAVAERAAADMEGGVAEAFALHAAHPNPFLGRTTLTFELPVAGPVRLAVYDVLGREVAVLVDGELEAGRHEAAFEGSRLPSGAYLVRLEAAGSVRTGPVTLLR